MKTILVAGVAGLTLLAGNAFAEGCRYGSPESIASMDEATQSRPATDEDAGLLAALREQEVGEAPVVTN